MWQLILKKEYSDVVIKQFTTKKEAEEEIQNRTSLTRHLGEDPAKLYKIERV
jgi:hypothetical protein